MAKINSINNASYALTSDTILTASLGDVTITDGDALITNKDAGTTSPLVYFNKMRAAAALTSGDLTGTIKFSGYDGTQNTDSARITSTSSGTIASTRVAGDLKFYTHPDSAAADPTLRMTIGPAGNITVAAPDAGTALTVTSGGITATAGNIAASSGTLSASTTVTAGTNLVSTAGNLLLPTTTATVGQIQINSVLFGHNKGTRNTFWGENAGNTTLTASNHVGIGYNALKVCVNGDSNTAVGTYALDAAGASACVGANSAFGSGSGTAVTTGSYNMFFGKDTGYQLTTGDGNCLIGTFKGSPYGAGANYTSSESFNICINNAGTVGESHKIRIGTQGSGDNQQNACYIAGIYGVTVSAATTALATVDTNGQLGSMALATNGQIPVGSTGAAPVMATITAGANITVTNGAGSITLASSINTVNDQTESYQLVAGDAGKFITMTKGSANTLIVPKDATVNFAIGTYITVYQGGAGTTTLAPEDGAITINSVAGNLDISAQYGVAKLHKIAANLWVAYGDLA